MKFVRLLCITFYYIEKISGHKTAPLQGGFLWLPKRVGRSMNIKIVYRFHKKDEPTSNDFMIQGAQKQNGLKLYNQNVIHLRKKVLNAIKTIFIMTI